MGALTSTPTGNLTEFLGKFLKQFLRVHENDSKVR